MALTNKGKQALANALLHQAGNLVEFRQEYLDDYEDLTDASTDDIAAQLTVWLQRLPGDSWNSFLPMPEAIADGKKGYEVTKTGIGKTVQQANLERYLAD